ncbi:replication initiation factor domain-containing protein [Staphylococcus pseudintermedius]|nr:replication initiation factor domain-containing protein [Staphylococcus pseudintermedius]
MRKQEQGNLLNQSSGQEKCNFSLTGYSNSRLSGQTLGKTQPKLSFDSMTIVGNLKQDMVPALTNLIAYDPVFEVWDILQTRFKAKAFNTVYIEYDKIKGDNWGRRNMRVEFNPNQLSQTQILWLKRHVISCMDDVGFTRLDLAFDFECDLSDYYTMSDKSLKKTVFYGRDGKYETKYFGVRESNRFIRIYNKKQERKDNADIEIDVAHFWRVEIELKHDMVDYWNDCFNDLHILKPAWANLEKINEQAMVYTLLHEESMWGKLSKNTKTKFKKMIKEISPVDLTDLMKLTLRESEKKLQKQIDFWLSDVKF